MNSVYSSYATSIPYKPSVFCSNSTMVPSKKYQNKVLEIIPKQKIFSIVLFDSYDSPISKEVVYNRKNSIPVETYTTNIPLFSHPLDRDLNILFFSQSFTKSFLYSSPVTYQERSQPYKFILDTKAKFFGFEVTKNYASFFSRLRFLLLRRFINIIFRTTPRLLRLGASIRSLPELYRFLRFKKKNGRRYRLRNIYNFSRPSRKWTNIKYATTRSIYLSKPSTMVCAFVFYHILFVFEHRVAHCSESSKSKISC